MSNELSDERIDQLLHLQALLEDTIEYYCDEHVVSGQTAWTMVASLAEAKLNVEFPDER
jgi:hypothetical protein|tara:strand:+ start:147 stop:323 length:177 start_codon:yes stop_codon:yes gene_type:complete